MDPDTKANTQGGGALERGHSAPFEPLTQLGDALGRVGAVASEAEAAELVPRQTAHVAVSMGADTKANTRGGGALEVSDHRLVEDGNERSCALDSDVIVAETSRNSGGSQTAGACQRALTQERQTLGA